MINYRIFFKGLLVVSDTENILMSLDLRHAEKIFAGSKRVELRRRNMHIPLGTIVWIYATLPTGAIIGQAKIVKIHAASPVDLWQCYAEVSGLTKKEFFDYFSGVTQGVALVLEDAKRLHQALSLHYLRKISKGFHPPQFFTRFSTQHPILNVISASSLNAKGCVYLNTHRHIISEPVELV
jgi:predicted transcriptional regulator